MAEKNISIIYDFFFGKTIIEALNIKEALEYYDHKVYLFEANASLVENLQNNKIDLVFNLARNRYDKNLPVSVASICELLELNIIGPKVFPATICKDKVILKKLLKWENINLLSDFKDLLHLKSLNVSTLGNDCELMLLYDLHDNYKIEMITSDDIKEICKKTFYSIHATDFCEFLIFLDENKNIFLSEINLTPYLDKNSSLAILFELLGFNYIDFINSIILNALKRYKIPLPEDYLDLEERIHLKTKEVAVPHK
ncbi:MAG: hypothetical protein EAX96_15570 [Candidatus Lokiarchaeota archaeon]|nr:hypothetical protein [Candidatus Lokiarchaeota archaeon]